MERNSNGEIRQLQAPRKKPTGRTLLGSGKLPTKDTRQPKQQSLPTVGQAALLCQAEWDRTLGKGKISTASHSGYGYLLAPVLQEWKHSRLHDLGEEAIRDYRIRVAEQTKAKLVGRGEEDKNCNVLANRRLFVIKQVFALATKHGLDRKGRCAGHPVPVGNGQRKEERTEAP